MAFQRAAFLAQNWEDMEQQAISQGKDVEKYVRAALNKQFPLNEAFRRQIELTPFPAAMGTPDNTPPEAVIPGQPIPIPTEQAGDGSVGRIKTWNPDTGRLE